MATDDGEADDAAADRVSRPEFDARLKSAFEFNLHDVESVRLILRGGSVIDWHRLDFADAALARRFIRNHEFDPEDPRDRAYTEHVKSQSIAYLRRNFGFAIPRPVEGASLEELLLMASGRGHRQQCACTILKVMQIINHLAGRELLFRLPVSDRDLFHLVEEKVYRVVGAMLSEGFPIAEFVGGRKNLDSTYTKLLSKAESTAAAVYDKLRFRIVTQTRDDLLPVLLYLSERLFPFNYVVPNQSTNTIFHFRSYCEGHPHLKDMVDHFQGAVDDTLTPGDNRFSAREYRVIHFVADVPVRVPAGFLELAPAGSEAFGPIVYLLCEFQLVDAETDEANETGEASHSAYKQRQRDAVFRRLRLGAREPTDPRKPSS
ncbi:MAG: TIGR04552 family protein [Deltaproteobacteria bacterium]|nr:TIGR04552 family protein [Deltaproteobacteria bacterium]